MFQLLNPAIKFYAEYRKYLYCLQMILGHKVAY